MLNLRYLPIKQVNVFKFLVLPQNFFTYFKSIVEQTTT